jgi:hypothetical protein
MFVKSKLIAGKTLNILPMPIWMYSGVAKKECKVFTENKLHKYFGVTGSFVYEFRLTSFQIATSRSGHDLMIAEELDDLKKSL